MSKYKCLMPAGMSDEDDDDDDVFFPSEETVKERSYNPRKESTKEKAEVVNFDQIYDEQRIIENRLVKACTMADLEVIEEYLQQSEIVEQLLAHGANPNKHKDGFTPLMALCTSTKETNKSLRCLELLIQAKADANVKNRRRETALMYACRSQNAEFVAKFIKHIQDVNACDSDGKTALMYAAAANKPDIVRILLEHDANISLTDIYGFSAKDIADTKGFTEISALLATDEEEVLTTFEIAPLTTWRDLFSNLYPRRKEILDYDISVMLYGMGLEKYGVLFQGMDIKTFLQLMEDDLCRLGIDITIHREQFLESLEKFHRKKWCINSFGNIKKTDSYTIYNGVISLANAKRQIGVIASSFQYIKNNLLKAASENIYLSPMERIRYEEELRKTQKSLKFLRNEIKQVTKLAQEIDKENNIGIPATWINPQKNKSDWTITIGITLMIGLCLCKTTYIQRLWNMYNIRI